MSLKSEMIRKRYRKRGSGGHNEGLQKNDFNYIYLINEIPYITVIIPNNFFI